MKVQEKASITPTQQECAGAYLSSELIGEDTLADLILLVSAEGTQADNWVAYAAACQINEYTGRPTIGRINFNPYYLTSDFDLFFDSFGTTLHELTHVMVFSPDLWQYYINWTEGRRRTAAEVSQDVVAGGVTWTMITTPRVQSWVRSNFDCPSLAGAPLENEGGIGSVGSHWEREFFGNEYMTSATVINPVVSDLTWALYIDSGWYQFPENSILPNGNELKSESFTWLVNEGCDVYDKTCPENGVECATTGEAGCSFDHTFQASCQQVSNADSCKWYKPTNFWDQDCRVSTNQSASQLQNLQSFGVNRRCFVGDFGTRTSLCYLPRCTQNSGVWTLEIQVGGEGWVTCVNDLEQIPVSYTPVGSASAVSGTVTCPEEISSFCHMYSLGCPNDCNMRGRCMKSGQCMCYGGFTGADCGDVLLNGTYVNRYGGVSTTVAVQGCPYNGGISQHSCNNGVCVSSLGYCMCYVNYQGYECDKEFDDFVTGGFYYGNILSFGILAYVTLNLYFN